MQLRTSIIFLSLVPAALATLTASAQMNCHRLFRDEYVYFLFKHSQDVFTERLTAERSPVGVEGTLHYAICGYVPPIEGCASPVPPEAKAVFVPAVGADCMVVLDRHNWIAKAGVSDARARKFSFEQPVDLGLRIRYNFICSEDPVAKSDVYYMHDAREFDIVVTGKTSCGISLNLMRSLTENPIVLIIFLSALGIILNFFGIKFYRDFLLYLLGILVIVFGFYIYNFFTGANNVKETENPYVMIALSILVIVAVIGVLVFFTSLIFILLSFLAAYQLGVYIKDAVISRITAVSETVLLWIIVGILFAVFLVLNYKFQDYFVMICTAMIGSAMLSTVILYFVHKNFDFLFNLEYDDFRDMQDYQNSTTQFTLTGLMLFLIGFLAQYIMFKRAKAAERPANAASPDLKIELKGI